MISAIKSSVSASVLLCMILPSVKSHISENKFLTLHRNDHIQHSFEGTKNNNYKKNLNLTKMLQLLLD